MTARNRIFEIRNLAHSYNGRPVLFVDDLAFERGSITGLTGPNGSGKSTLLKLLGFALKPSQGEILFNGRVQVPYSRAVRSKVTLLTQEPYLLKRTVFDNIAYGLKIRNRSADLASHIREALDLVGLDFKEFSQRRWHELSGGEAQRVALAARLVLKPEVLLLDEPTASVDVKSAKLIRNASLQAKNTWGTTLIIASHDWHWLSEISDRQLHIFKGQVVSAGMENIIPGPWAPSDLPGLVERSLGNGAAIKAVPPPNSGMTALINIDHIHFKTCDTHDDSVDENHLTGMVTRLILERKTGDILITLSIHDIQLTFKFPSNTISNLELFPGKTITLCFSARHIEWI